MAAEDYPVVRLASSSGAIVDPAGGGGATAANQNTEIAALGAPSDSAYAGTGSASIVAALKGLYAALSLRNLLYVEASNVALSANAVTPLVGRSAPSWAVRVSASCYSDQAGSLNLRGSYDGGATYKTVQNIAVPANTDIQITRVGIGHTHFIAYFNNGTTAANSVSVSLSFSGG